MKRFRYLYLFFIFLVITVTAYAQSAEDSTSSTDITQLIIGKWEMTPNKYVLKSTISFDKNGTYNMEQKLKDNSGVGTNGGYKIDNNFNPVRIDLCLGKCGKPGSEWTTRFGIIRALSNDKVEICNSPNGNYPSDFPADTLDEYSMILTRIK